MNSQPLSTEQIEHFESDVLAHIGRLESRIDYVLLIPDSELIGPPAELQTPYSEEEGDAFANARSALINPEVRARICAALESVSDDLNEIYKPLVKILLPLSGVAAAYSAVTIGPMAVAMIAIIIAKAGIAAICEDVS